MPKDSLSVTDERTSEKHEIPIKQGAVPAMNFRQIKRSEDDFGLMVYDPGFSNTAYCRSKITYIDGQKGILRYRGYPIEQLAGEYSFMEVAYLLLSGELPNPGECEQWVNEIKPHTSLQNGVGQLIDSFPREAYPMGMLMSAVAALSSYYSDATKIESQEMRQLHIRRLIGKVPTIAACVHRQTMGLPFIESDQKLSYTGNFLNMTFGSQDGSYTPHPVLEKALDVLFVLHADHEQNCSTNAMRNVGSSRPDPYGAAAAAVSALSGPLHGGANEAVLRMLNEIGSKDRIAAHVERVKNGEVRLMGFGHRIYKSYDPRAKTIKRLADEVFEITGSNPLLDVALELEKIALEDEYFVERKLYPNVDFYSGLIYQALGFPPGMFPVLFAIGRTPGWVSQWEESLNDPEQRIARPRQIYAGYSSRDVPARHQSTSVSG